MFDAAVIGGGLAGLATAARLQARGFSTLVLEAHSHVGGCAGYFRRGGFAFDVGATTLVDFEPGGVGGQLFESVGLDLSECDPLPGYVAWLPDRCVTLYRDLAAWAVERLRVIGDSPAHRRFWAFLDELARTFWKASRSGIKLPIRSLAGAIRDLKAIPCEGLGLLRFIGWTMGDALRHFGLADDAPLTGLLSMLVEDTVHATLNDAPLINAALGVTIRGAGLVRHRGGMYGFWLRFVNTYQNLGGMVRCGCHVQRVDGQAGDFTVHTTRGDFSAAQVISAVPAAVTSQIAPPAVGKALGMYLERDADHGGGAIVMFLGVPDWEVDQQHFTHHQLLQDYSAPLGNGNNMFISVSAPGDTRSAPEGCRAVMISTHCELEEWQNLPSDAYQIQKQAMGDCLLTYARRVYPNLGEKARVFEIGTPITYQRFTGRPRGAVGGVRQNRGNSNQNAIPYEVGMKGFWLVGDSTWPGLGTVACVLGSRHVADGAARLAPSLVRGVRS